MKRTHGAKYVYCIIERGEGDDFGKGLGGYKVYTVPYRDISAVVSDTPLMEYEPNEANVLAHEKVVEAVMRERSVLPLGFGNVFINENRVRWLLAKFYLSFKTYLTRLKDKVEVGVKVFFDVKPTRREVEETSEEVRKLKEDIATKPTSEARLLEKKLSSVIEREVLREAGKRAYEYGVEVYEALKKCSEETCLNKRIGEDMILNGAFLVHKDKVADFKKELERLRKEYKSKGLKFQYSGPWPPYNFAQIHIRK